MASDASIYGLVQQQQPFNPLAQLAQYQQLQQLQQQNKLGQLAFQDRERAVSDDNALRAAAKNFSNNPQANAQMILSTTGNIKAAQDYLKGSAAIGKDAGEAAKLNYGNFQKQLESAQTPDQAASLLRAGYADPNVGPLLQRFGPIEHGLQLLQQSAGMPGGFENWRAGAALGIGELAKTAKVNNVNLGGTMQTQLVQPATGQVQSIGSAPITQSADNAATQATSRANNAATQAGENARAEQSRQTQLMVAGMGPNGAPSDNVEAMAQAIAAGRTGPISGFALARPQGQAVMARVMAINPEYDATTYGAKAQAAKAFTTGKEGAALRSFAVAGDHLEQLGGLVDALNNGNTQLINKIGNNIAMQTGSVAPTNFEAVKEIVGKEVVKAIVAGGGGVSERQEISQLLSNAKSPQQLKGAISQMRTLMAAQHEHLLQQRRAAGLPDSTIPDYKAAGSAADALPAGVRRYNPATGKVE